MNGKVHQRLHQMYSSRFYKRIFFSVIALLLAVTLLVSFFFYSNFLSPQRESIRQLAIQSLGQIESRLSERLQELFSIVIAIDANGVYTYAPLAAKAQRDALLNDLMRYVRDNGFIQDMSYQSLLDESVIYSSQGIFDKAVYQKHIYRTTERFDQDAFSERLTGLTFATLSSDELSAVIYPTSTLAFVYGLPLMSRNPKRFITFYINKDKLDQIVGGALPFGVTDVTIEENGAPVYALKGAETNGQDESVSLASSTTALTFSLRADPDVMYAAYNRNILFFSVLLSVTLLVILFSGFMISFYSYNPLYRLMKKLAGQRLSEGKTDEMALLNDMVEDAMAQKQRMARRLFISNLVWEQYEDMDAAAAAAQEVNIEFPYPAFTCCAVLYEGILDAEQKIENLLDQAELMAVSAKRHGQNRLTVVVNHESAADAEARIAQAIACLPPVAAGVSGTGGDILHLSALHSQARSALHFAMKDKKGVVCFRDMPEAVVPAAEECLNPVKKDDPLCAKILDTMTHGLKDNSLSLEFIAGQCGISASYLVRYFKGAMGVTPMQYVDTKRMDIAKELLADTDYSLRRIVDACGYLDESNFARKFKKQEGMTPMNYRKAEQEKKAGAAC